MIVKLTKHGKGDVRKAIQYVLQERNNKGEKREQIQLVYGNPDELIAIANSSDFRSKVKKLKYFSGVLALSERERLTQEQIQSLVTQFGKTLNNGGQTDIPFIVIRHVEGEKEHYHFIGLRYDLNTRSFSNPFRPRWERKWIPWAKQMEYHLGLKKVERKRDWIEQTYFNLQLLCSRNPRLYKHFEFWFKVLELAFIIKNFRLLLEVDDERLKRVLSKANRPYPEFCNATNPKEIGQLVQREIERDRKHNEKYKTAKSHDNSKYVIERIEHYPILNNDIKEMKEMKGEVKMEKTQNAKEELELFKKEIDLVEFWTSNGGQVLERSSKNSIRIQWNDEKFLVSRNENGHWLFQGVDDESKRGSIIDLCNLMGLKNLGEIRKKLRLYLNFKPKEEKTIQTQKKEEKEEIEINWKEKVRLLGLNEVVNLDIWSERGIDPHQLDIFLKNVYTDERGNLCFPIYNDMGEIIGYEVKGRRGFKMNLGSKQGLVLIGENTLLNEKLVITESVFDALSYEQLRPQPKKFYDCLYISISGQFTEKQMEQIKKLVEHKRIGALKEVIIAFDNDEQGRKYSEKLKQYLKNLEIQVKEHYSQAKDWNDELKKEKYHKERIKWQKGEKKGLRLVR